MASRATRSGRRACDPFRFDQELLAQTAKDAPAGDHLLAGADEAGRGCLAGPLVAAAVVLDYSGASFGRLEGLTDSKQLVRRAREELFPAILSAATRVSWVAVSPLSIDEMGLHRSNLAALTRALQSLGGEYSLAIVDGFELKRPELRSRAVIGADYKSATVAAASVVAKVVRDRLMVALSREYPEYGFEDHMGYGTVLHKDALRRHGPCFLHRLSFQGVETPQLELWDE